MADELRVDATVLTCDRAWPRLNRRARIV